MCKDFFLKFPGHQFALDRYRIIPYNCGRTASPRGGMSKLNLPINELHQVIVENGIETCVGTDGRHMTKTGNRVLADAVMQAIVNRLK